MRVLVQGAGPAGLGLAMALHRHGIRADVIDRAPADRRQGFAVGLHGSGHRAAELLGLLPALQARAVPLGRARYLYADGRAHFSYDYRRIAAAMNGRMLAIMRDALQDVLIAAAGRIDIRFQLGVIALKQDEGGVSVALSDGSAARYDAVIGADGYRSGLRRLAFGGGADPLRHLGYRIAAWRFRPAAPLAESVLGMADVDRHATLYALPDGAAATLFCWRDPDPQRLQGAARREYVQAAFGDWPEPVRGALAGCRDWQDCFLDTVSQIEMAEWSHGRVGLLGDAAWCPTFLSGQGTSLALAGAMVLAEELARQAPALALAAYERRMRPAVGRVQAAARRIGGQYVPTSRRAMRLQGWLAPLLFSRPMLPLVARRMAAAEIGFGGPE